MSDYTTTTADIYDRIASGEFRTKKSYPPMPKRPALLDKRAGDLTLAEMDELAKVTEDHKAACAAAATAHSEYNEDEGRLIGEFADALFAEHDIPPGHPFGQRMWSIACERGHASGMHDVASCFADLVELWEEALKMVVQAKKDGKK